MKAQCIKIYGMQLKKYLGGKSSQINDLLFHFYEISKKKKKIKPKVNRN